jgi:hypothetical protein
VIFSIERRRRTRLLSHHSPGGAAAAIEIHQPHFRTIVQQHVVGVEIGVADAVAVKTAQAAADRDPAS